MGHQKRGFSPGGDTIPIGTIHGIIPLLEDKPHMKRIVLVMRKELRRVKTEIKVIKVSNLRNRTRFTQDLIRVVAEHLPEALKELQTASVNHQTSMFEEKIKTDKEKIKQIEAEILYYKELLSESKDNEKYLSDEISRISDELRQAHEKEQQYKDFLLKMQIIIENKKLEITELKRTSVFQAKGIEYQRLEMEIGRLLQENKNLNEHLEQARNSANEKEHSCEKLNFTIQTLSHQHNEEMEAFKSFCEMQAKTRIDELDIEKHNAISLKSALEKIHKERTNLLDELTEIKGYALRQESEIKHLRSEISKLKMAHEMHEKEIKTELGKAQKQNQQLLLEKTKLIKDLQQGKDNVKDHERECYSIKEEMLKLREKQEKEMQGLKTADDIQRKLNVENYDLKKEIGLLREEKIKLEEHFAHQKENKREKDANEKELNRQKLAFETQVDALNKEIHKAQQHNQQLLQDVDKLYNELHHEKENAKELKTKFDVVTKELQMLTETQEEAQLMLKKSDEIQQKVYIENQALKNEVSVQRYEIIKLKTDLTHRQEHEREKHTKEQDINKLKLAYETQQDALNKDIHKAHQQNQELLQDKANLYNELQQEKDNAIKIQTDFDIVREELRMLKETHTVARLRLKESDDIRQKVNNENQELKNKLSEQRREIMKLKTDLTHRQENERENHTKEQDINKLKLAYETQQDALNKDIHKAHQQNQELLQNKAKLYNDLQQEKDNAIKIQTEFDIVREELQMLKETHTVARLRLKESDDIRQKVNNENQELKNELSEQRREIMKLKTDLTHRQENEREKHTKEQDINKLKLAYEMQQDALNKDIHKAHQQNQELLQDKAKLYNDLQKEKDNAIKIQTEFDIVREELRMLKETHTVARLMLKESDDIRLKVNKENQELKNELSEQSREIMKLKTDLTHREENERKQITNEQDIIKLKVAFEMQKEALLREIQDIKHQNQQLLLSNRKLHLDLQQEQDDVTKNNTERDAIIAELNQLRTKHQEAIKNFEEAGDFQEKVNAENERLKTEVSNMRREIIDLKQKLTHQQENANEHDQARSNLKKDMKLLQDQIKQFQTENKKLSKDLDIAQETAKALDKHRSEKASFQDIITKQEKEISNLRFMLQEQNNLNKNLSKDIESANLTVDKCKQHIMKQEQIIETQKRGIAKLESVNKKHDVEGRVANRNTDSRNEESDITIKDLQQQLARVREQLKNVQQELDDTKSRLSRAMGDKLTDNNPNIADLSDRNRPTKISERYQELYDNQWTDAFEVVDGTKRNEEKTIETLMNILLETMAFCTAESANQMKTITETLSKGKDIPANTMKQIKDLRKSSAENYGKGLYTEYFSRLNQSKSVATKIPSFVKECFEICWLMVVQDPPVVLGPEIRRDTPFNKDHYKAYTKGGKRLDYVVWPVLLLHQDGPVLCKGVAQGY